ncbi:MAG: dephospho-CoA kinase [Bacteroidales bacterium]|nr:dephospho-CoA kinase [Bacteroidales bacterium]
MSEYHPLIIGLTGSIGSGKTLITKVFKHLGVSVYLSDDEAKKLYQSREMVERIEHLFGKEVITNNQIDKKKLANLVFNDKDSLEQLNKCIHPLVKKDFEIWTTKQTSPYVILESAIIYEIGWESMFDKIISIFTPMNFILERVQQRDNQTKEHIMQRILNQLPQEEKQKRSDYVIINDNRRLVIPQIKKIHSDLLVIAKDTQRICS